MKDIYVQGLGWVQFLPWAEADPMLYIFIRNVEYHGEVYYLLRYGTADMGFYYYTMEDVND